MSKVSVEDSPVYSKHEEDQTTFGKADYIEVTETFQLSDRNTLKQMYQSNDTHFSESGAALVAELIMKKLDSRPDLRIKP